MVSVETNSLLQAGIAAAQAGNCLLARMHLEAAVYLEHDNSEAWLWLAWTADSPAHAISCLEWVLHFDRRNELALAGLVWARRLQGFQSQAEVSQSATAEVGSASTVEFEFEQVPNLHAFEAAACSTDICVAEPVVVTDTATAIYEFDGSDESNSACETEDAGHEFVFASDVDQPEPMADIEDRIEHAQELIAQEIDDSIPIESQVDSQIECQLECPLEAAAALQDDWFEDEWFEDDFLTAYVDGVPTAESELPSHESDPSDAPSEEFIEGLSHEWFEEPIEEPLGDLSDEIISEPVAELSDETTDAQASGAASVSSATFDLTAPSDALIAELIDESLTVADEAEVSAVETVSLFEDLQFEDGEATDAQASETASLAAPPLEVATPSAAEAQWEFTLPDVPTEVVVTETPAETPASSSDIVCSEGAFEFELHQPHEAASEPESVEPESVVAELSSDPIADSDGHPAEADIAAETDAADETATCLTPIENAVIAESSLPIDPVELLETPPAKPRVLVVDDSVTVRKLIALTLTRHGFEVLEAEDGVAALRDIALQLPDLVLADINMPKLDGYRLCRLVKSHENTRHIPVILVSGLCGEEHVLRGKLVGCDAYITKPVVPETVLEVVIEHLVAMGLGLIA